MDALFGGVLFFLNVSGSMRLFLPPGGSIVLRHDFYLLKSFVQRGGCSGLGLFTLEISYHRVNLTLF